LAKVQADELTTDASGIVSELPLRQRGQQRLASALDRDASFRKHGDEPAVLGYNAVISTTATRIRAAVALTGATSDSLAPIVVLEQQRDAALPLPADLVMDQAAGWGKTRAQVDAISQGQTRLTARVPQAGGSDPSRFGVADFQVDAARTRCTCPNSVVSTKAHASQAGDGVHFRFLASQCRGCPLWSQCREPSAKPNGNRVVFISEYHVLVRQAQAFNQTAGRALLAGRWQVEPVIAWLVRWQGCRRARRMGQAAAQCQLYQACAVRNLLSWLSRVRRGLAPPLP
jgi:Transposase DDE domain